MSEGKGTRKRARGIVQSDKMDKSVTVAVTTLVKHPLYGKYVHRVQQAHGPRPAE